MNNRQRMYVTNKKIRDHLSELGFHSFYLFPHMRFNKDYILEGCSFDAIAFKKDDTRIYFLQFKTNRKPTKQILEDYKKLEEKYSIKCLWISSSKKGVFIY